MQVVLRRKQTNTNPSQIVALENEFADLADWLQRKLMGIEFTGPYALESIDEGLRKTDLEYYSDANVLLTIITCNVATYVEV